MKELLSPKQVARAIGVSESSLKRWCDQGLIQTVRTGGGHRKLPLQDVIRFLREGKHEITCPEVLGMPARSEHSEIGLAKGRAALAAALIQGNEALSRQIVLDLYLAKHSISVICDDVVCGAFREIGQKWSCQSIDVYQERRGCELAHRILYELRRSLPPALPGWKACGGTLSGDFYTLPTAVTEIVLLNAGWEANSLGASIPADSMVQAITELKPRLFWVCVSHIEDVDRFVAEFQKISDAAERNQCALVVGGRALEAEIREQIRFCCYCDTMQQLELFATTIRRLAVLFA